VPRRLWTCVNAKTQINTNLPPALHHPAVLVGDFNSHHPDWGYQEADLNGESLQEWALNNDYLLLHDAKQRGTFHSARWQRDYSPDLCWISTTVGRSQVASSVVLGDFPHSQHRPSVIHIGLHLPIIRGVQRKRWNFRRADWASYTLATERSIPLIPVNNISVEESYQRFCGVMQKAVCHSIPRGFRPTCFNKKCQDLLKQYEESGDPDIADHLIESLDVARRHRWEELTSKMNFTHSSRKSWALICRLGAALQPTKSTHSSVSANAVAFHLIQVAKAPHDNKFERQVRMQGRTLLQLMSDKSLPHPFTEEISTALQKTKPVTAPGYDNIHVEFLKNLGPKARTWQSKFFSRNMATHSISKIWRKAKVIAVEKLGKDPRVWQLTTAQSYCWVCVTSSWSVLHSSAFPPHSKDCSVQTRLVSGKVEASVTRLLPSPLLSKMDSSRT